MKKLVVLVAVLAMVMSMAGCMVATNEVMALPGMDDAGNEYALYTYYGETVAPLQTVDLPAGKNVNVVEIDLEGAKAYAASMTEEEKASITSGTLNDMDYAYASIRDALAAEGEPSQEEIAATEAEIDQAATQAFEDAAEEALSEMPEGALDEAGEAEFKEEMDQVQEALVDAMDASMADLLDGRGMIDDIVSLSGLGIATYRASSAQAWIDAFYPGYIVNKAYTMLITDINGLYPTDGPKDITVRIKESEAGYPAKVALISPNGAVSTRLIKEGKGEINFSVPSTPGTLVLLLNEAAAPAAEAAAEAVPAAELTTAQEAAPAAE